MIATPAYVGLGGNVGDVPATLRSALDAIATLPGITLQRTSRFYRTLAWGLRDQPDFVNAVACVQTSLGALDLLHALLAIERAHGRDRDAAQRWGPRTLDLDLLLYDDAVIDIPGLRVPHPHLHERAFVLLPLCEIAPDLYIPGIGTVHAACEAVAKDGIEALP